MTEAAPTSRATRRFRKPTSGATAPHATTVATVQVIIALVVTEGLPLAYEVLPGNTKDDTTLRGFLDRIERQYGKARRIWLMDRGVPTEEVLAEMRAADPPSAKSAPSKSASALRSNHSRCNRHWLPGASSRHAASTNRT